MEDQLILKMSGLPAQPLFVVRPSKHDQQQLIKFATAFRTLRLQALKESAASYTETYAEVASRPFESWVAWIQEHNGLIHMVFASDDDRQCRTDEWLLEHGKALGMAVNTGPVPQERFLCPHGSELPLNRPDAQEVRIYSNQLYFVPDLRGKARAYAHTAFTLDCDNWLMEQLLAKGQDPPAVARFRGVVIPGAYHAKLLEFYARNGWYIAGKLSWSDVVMADGGEEGVKQARGLGYDMTKLYTVVETTVTVPQLRWRIEQAKFLLAAAEKGKAAKL